LGWAPKKSGVLIGVWLSSISFALSANSLSFSLIIKEKEKNGGAERERKGELSERPSAERTVGAAAAA